MSRQSSVINSEPCGIREQASKDSECLFAPRKRQMFGKTCWQLSGHLASFSINRVPFGCRHAISLCF